MIDKIPILKLGPFLLLSIQVDMHDQLALDLQEDLTEQIIRHKAKGVLIDISALEIVDSFIGRMLSHIAQVSRILDAKVIVVGMQPAVAITLVELGLSLEGIATALNMEKGMRRLEAMVADDESLEESEGAEVTDASPPPGD
ncbi:rsbT antagonist protein RsbS [Pseudomonas psychrotolerans]|uniref:RsbT antagonist protein RsbS n=1 Tax=Pseudomonas oryzihabitans TaxID=47885 RepID=A0AAJ2BHI9_9PSED|nr:rsbT antagonist protein RsbS [Pseudomonas psychrotolerans]MDR6356518.1 rsbT antagonist protein RsbS [Pseudomonas psychrotolerans]MDR6676776.1 rsbT antagonist protein RsbS [Pseudomonas psychrotolerans]